MRAILEKTALIHVIRTVWRIGVSSWVKHVWAVFQDTQEEHVIQVVIEITKKKNSTKNTPIYHLYNFIFNNSIYLNFILETKEQVMFNL